MKLFFKVLGGLVLLFTAFGVWVTQQPPPAFTPHDDAAFACFWSVRQKLVLLGTPADSIHEQYPQESVKTVKDHPGMWQCRVVIEAPNIYGATRVSFWLVEVTNFRKDTDGTLRWDIETLDQV
jgi:hypothetical protein